MSTSPKPHKTFEDTVVFLGPTLPASEAHALLPGVRICPPVRCGDVLTLLQLEPAPRRIVIIDGVFEVTAAVWHKELLMAMREGCLVYGAASMGALRASELHVYGMIGVGTIFEDYRDGVLLDDDEVAVLHAEREGAWRVLTDAMVNIRATLDLARADGIIDDDLSAEVCSRAKAMFYQERTLDYVLEAVGPPAADLRTWAVANGVDQKRRDAMALLELLAASKTPPERPSLVRTPIRTLYLRNLQNIMACRPPTFLASWLPRPLRLASTSRLLGVRYRLLNNLALALAYLDACATDAPPSLSPSPTDLFWLEPGETLGGWRDANDVSDDASARYARLDAALREGERALEGLDDALDLDLHVDNLVRIFDLYPAWAALRAEGVDLTAPTIPGDRLHEPRETMRLIRTLARVWRVLDLHLRQLGLEATLDGPFLSSYSQQLLDSGGVGTEAQMGSWLQRNGLEQPGAYAAFVIYAAWFAQCLNPLSGLLYAFFEIDASRNWLVEALRVSGTYGELVGRLSKDPGMFGRQVAGYWAQLPEHVRTTTMLNNHIADKQELKAIFGQLSSVV